MKTFKIIQNSKRDQSIQMRQNSQMSSDCTASEICSVQSSLCIDNHSFVSDHAGVVSDHAGVVRDQAGFESDQAVERDDSDNRHSRNDQGNIWSMSSGKNDNHNSTQSKISQRSLTYHNSLSNTNIVETQF